MYRSLRKELYSQLESKERKDGLSPTNKAVAILIVIASLVAVFETEDTIRLQAPNVFFYLEVVFVSLFSVEYVARFIAAGEEHRYAGFYGRLRFLFSGWSIIDLVAILPFILTFGGSNFILVRMLKFLRLIRLIRFGVFGKAWVTIETAVSRRKYELILSLGVAGGLLILSSSLLYLAESKVQPNEFGSIPRALWWAIATLTTVGYGDVTPITVLGRIFAGFAAIAGIGLVAMPAGVLAAAFSDVLQERRVNTTGESHEDESL